MIMSFFMTMIWIQDSMCIFMPFIFVDIRHRILHRILHRVRHRVLHRNIRRHLPETTGTRSINSGIYIHPTGLLGRLGVPYFWIWVSLHRPEGSDTATYSIFGTLGVGHHLVPAVSPATRTRISAAETKAGLSPPFELLRADETEKLFMTFFAGIPALFAVVIVVGRAPWSFLRALLGQTLVLPAALLRFWLPVCRPVRFGSRHDILHAG